MNEAIKNSIILSALVVSCIIIVLPSAFIIKAYNDGVRDGTKNEYIHAICDYRVEIRSGQGGEFNLDDFCKRNGF